MQPQSNQRATLLIAVAILVAAGWPKIGPVVQPYIDRITNVVVVSANPFSDGSKLRVMVVYPVGEGVLPKDQEPILFGVSFRELIESAGGEFKAFDNENEFMGDDYAVWQKVITANVATPMPYIAIGNGSKGTVQALPANLPEAEALVRKYL